MKSRASPREDLPARLRSMSQASQETLLTTQFARDLTKHSADIYLRLTVLPTQKPLKWKQIASTQLAGQIDRVLTKVMHYYGPEGHKYAGKQMKIADMMVGTELAKLMDLIHVTPKAAAKEQRKKSNSMVSEDRTFPEIRRGRASPRRSEFM